MENILTIDVEEWFQTQSLRKYLEGKPVPESRICMQVEKMLELLDLHDARATFFVVGELAERFPHLIRRISACGHEVGSHGYRHLPLGSMEPGGWKMELERSKGILEKITKKDIVGFRAPSWSIPEDKGAFFDALQRLGYLYDSSSFPFFWHAEKGFPSPVYRWENGVYEISNTTFPIGNVQIPFNGGFFLRMLPINLLIFFFKRRTHLSFPAMIYIHPWELDPEHPRIKCKIKSYLIHYANLKNNQLKFVKLIKTMKLKSIVESLPAISKEFIDGDSKEISYRNILEYI